MSRYATVKTDDIMPMAHEVDNLEAGSHVAFASQVIFVNLKTLDDRTLRIQSSDSQTLREFRLEVQKVTGVAPVLQRLVSNGRLLRDEDAPLHLEDGSFVHLTQAPSTNANPRPRNDSSDSDESFEESFESHRIVQAHIAQLQGLAWLVVVFFTLLAWRLFMSITFHDDPQNRPAEVNIVHFILSVYGMVVGGMGVHAASLRNRTYSDTQRKIKAYAIMLAILAFLYFITSLWEIDSNSNSIMGVFILQSMFWYCILQAQMTHRALRPADTATETSHDSNNLPVAVAVPTVSQSTQPTVEMTNFSSASNNVNTTRTLV